MKRRTLILLGAASFVIGLLLLAPAAILHGWSQSGSQAAPYQVFGLQGTLSQGAMAGLNLNGRPALTDLRWQLQPLWLLLGRSSFHVEGGGQTIVDGSIAFSPFGALRLRNFLATGSIKPLLAAAGQAFLPVEGQARMDIRSLKLVDGLPQSVDGEIQIQNLAWTLAREPLLLGDYRAELSADGDDNLVKIVSSSGPLELSGNGKFSLDQSYELELRFRPKPEASAMLRNLVAGAGTPDTQGYYSIRQRGKLVQ